MGLEEGLMGKNVCETHTQKTCAKEHSEAEARLG